jgi:hypothetical protein
MFFVVSVWSDIKSKVKSTCCHKNIFFKNIKDILRGGEVGISVGS